LSEQQNRVSENFINRCRDEVLGSNAAFSGRDYFATQSELAKSSLDKLRSQYSGLKRERVFSSEQFQKMLLPAPALGHQKRSLLQRIINFANPFDQTNITGNDWLSNFRNSGQALKSEMIAAFNAYQDLLNSAWEPHDHVAWTSLGARLIALNAAIKKLAFVAETLILNGQGKEAGFTLSITFALFKGLASERSMLLYLIAKPELIVDSNTWNGALQEVSEMS
jgi:hypothetical protein